ncbi:MAG: chemotaxis protein CheD [Fibrobacterota bacterium]
MTGETLFVPVGHCCVPRSPLCLKAVTASGIVITVFEHKKGIGGLCHFSHPYRRGANSSPHFAAPAVYTLIRKIEEFGGRKRYMDVSLYGGAENRNAPRYKRGLSRDNVAVAQELLDKFGIFERSVDTGGTYGRKILFNSWNGETVAAKIQKVRQEDWYPKLKTAIN